MDDSVIKDAVHASIAKTILEGLDTDARDAILQKSITSALSDYTFRNGINEVVAEKAVIEVRKLIESEEWTGRIVETIRIGFDDYLSNLRTAIQDAVALSIHGKEGKGYNTQAAALLRCWPNSKQRRSE